MTIKTNVPALEIELKDLANLFGQHNEIEIDHQESKNTTILHDKFVVENNGQEKVYEFSYQLDPNLSDLEQKSLRKKMLKNHLYQTLNKELKMSLPWGSLTGIRPTKLVRDMIEKGQIKEYLAAEALEKMFFVSEPKAKLVANILKNQKCIIRNDNLIDIYVNIPICPTRCVYCSFISHKLSALGDEKVEKYLDSLEKELAAVKQIIADKAYIVRTIYVGGGTPSVLSESQLERLLKMLTFSVDEFTVECGRPDTITKEKLDVLKKHNVTRISINPQTFNDATLKRIGRKHTVKDTIMAYKLSLKYDFVVNMDIIAGLPKESFSTFKKSVDTLMELAPDNITVHTLAIKRGSLISEDKPEVTNKLVDKMVSYAESTLHDNGYKPYYLYRQKNQLDGQENVGYYKEHICLFNVDTMEECLSVIACGAGGISKRVFNLENRIEREANVKDIKQYIDRVDEMIEKKAKLFS